MRILTLVVSLLVMAGLARAAEKAGLKSTVVKVPGWHGTPEAMELLQLPPGKVTYANHNGKEITVEVKEIWMCKTEIIWPQYDAFWSRSDLKQEERWRNKVVDGITRPSTPYINMDRGWGHRESPAGSVHIVAATSYCKWLSKATGKTFRLPTEAEWIYACRAGGGPVRCEADELKELAWFVKNSDEQTHDVAKKKANAWGFFDMLGNVAEWVIGPDGVAVAAGGSFEDDAKDVHSEARVPYDPRWQRDEVDDPKSVSWMFNGSHVGLRVVMEER